MDPFQFDTIRNENLQIINEHRRRRRRRRDVLHFELSRRFGRT